MKNQNSIFSVVAIAMILLITSCKTTDSVESSFNGRENSAPKGGYGPFNPDDVSVESPGG